jgi:hypothetical protein
MRVNFDIIDAHTREHKVLNQFGALDMKVEYAVPCTDLFVTYSDKETQKIRKIDHIICGKINYEKIVFDVTVGVVIQSEYINDRGSLNVMSIQHVILGQDATDRNYQLRESDLFGGEEPAVAFEYCRIVNIGEYNMIKLLRKTDSIQEAFNQINDARNMI